MGTIGPAALIAAARRFAVAARAERARGRGPGRAPAFEPLELVHRELAAFPEGPGYNPHFLAGHPLPLPKPSTSLRHELAPRLDRPAEYLLPFRHFTTAVHARRRVPVFAAVNIDGGKKPAGGMPKRPGWSTDPRLDPSHQLDDSIFSMMLERGHLAARDYVYWGATPEEIAQADVHSFTLTNVCPQIAQFNAHKEWYEVERAVFSGAHVGRVPARPAG